MELSEPGWHWRKLQTLLLAEVQQRGVEFPARRSCHSTTPGGAGDNRKSVLFLVDMLHKEDLGKARRLWQQRRQSSSLRASWLGASGGSMDPALSQQPKLQEYFSPVSRHKRELVTYISWSGISKCTYSKTYSLDDHRTYFRNSLVVRLLEIPWLFFSPYGDKWQSDMRLRKKS